MEKREYTCTYFYINTSKTGKKIREYMNLRDISALDLANMIGVSNQCVYKWTNGQALPSVENLFQISKILLVKMDDIIVCEESYSFHLPEIYVREDVVL